MNDEQTTTKNQSDLSSRIVEKISRDQVHPVPRYLVQLYSYGVWVLWGLSVMVGAMAIAVIIYVARMAQVSLHEATHSTVWSFLVDIIPYVWLVCFCLMVGLAYINFRSTPRGYRYPIWQVIGSSLAFAIIGGVMLYVSGMGHLIDVSLSRAMPLYPSMVQQEMKLWQMPEDGRLVGRYVADDERVSVYRISDVHDTVWAVRVVDLRQRDMELLMSGELVRVIGTTTDRAAREFHACGVFPWFEREEGELTLTELKEERDRFLRQIPMFQDYVTSSSRFATSSKRLRDNDEVVTHCSNLHMLKRIPR